MTEPTKNLLYFIGKRETTEGKIAAAFSEGEDTRSFTYYPKAKAARTSGAIIGKQYDLTDGLPAFWSDAETGESVSDELKIVWETEARTIQSLRQQKSIDPSPELTKAVETIRLGLKHYHRNQRAAFIAWLLNKLI